MPKEVWVSPPVVALEPRSTKAATWRFRVIGLILLALVLLVFVLLFLKFSNVTGGENGGSVGLRPPVAARPAAP